MKISSDLLPAMAMALAFTIVGCQANMPLPTTTPSLLARIESIPANAIKGTPENDSWPPMISPSWSQPVPLGWPVNTAGGEDSPFILPDGSSLYFFFTPDVNIPAEQSLLDGITGIWVSNWTGAEWTEPNRVILSSPGELALDGCPFVREETLIFCSARAGNFRGVDLYTARSVDGMWTGWENWGETMNSTYSVGEMHISEDGQWLVFGSERPGGIGNMDLWISSWTGSRWSEPENLGPPINTPGDENRPFLSSDGQSLWYDSTSMRGFPGPAIFHSSRLLPDGSWSDPEEIISSFAGEPTLTPDENTLYFIHHYFSSDLSLMIEADIYVVHRLDQNQP
ncbi:MAG: hypothetical protein ABIJ39_07175 [Chloroflexota bacterium]